MTTSFQQHLSAQLADIRAAGTYKRERVIITPQGTTIRVADGKPVLNLCANNYLGLAQHPAIAAAAKEALDISQETSDTLRLYGIDQPETKAWGERCLIARRLVERGVRYVLVGHAGWDHHGNLPNQITKQCKDIDQPGQLAKSNHLCGWDIRDMAASEEWQ